jgi:predicted HicB family RNase H-like nuclease
MMNPMTYKDYTARIEYDDADRIFAERLAGICDIAGFHASTVDALETAFHESVDDYVQARKTLGQSPQKLASGKSLNQWAAGVLQVAAQA